MDKKKPMSFAKKKSVDKNSRSKWKILVVDDEEDVHVITKTVLSNFSFADKGLEFLDAYNGAEAIEMMQKHEDIALILLDVVMEEDDSGLKVVKYIRQELKNKFVRIVLRTGQPGSAPEAEVIRDYDINDYKEKTELTSNKLYTTVIASLRAFQDLVTIEKNRQGLQHIVDSSAKLFKMHSLQQFAYGVLVQILSILHLEQDSIYVFKDSFSALSDTEEFTVLAGTGRYDTNKNSHVHIEESEKSILLEAIKEERNIYKDDSFVGYFKMKNDTIHLLYINGFEGISCRDKELVELFSKNIAVAYENLYFDKQLIDTQTEILYVLSEVIEGKHLEVKHHIKRVAEFSYLFAIKMGMDYSEALQLKHAATMHDIGMVTIDDGMLLKPAKLTEQEYEKVKEHSRNGYEILKHSKQDILKIASIIALEHHERYDGSGYPDGKIGDDINLYARIIGLVDVFEALLHKKSYREAWEKEQVLDYIKEQSGKAFDPKLVDVLLTNVEEFFQINELYKDNYL